jgi:hypothetical protein
MAVQIPGVFGASQPDVFTRVSTRQRVTAVAAGARVVCVVGEGETEETIVQAARGGGLDGFNADYSGTNNPDGRHFKTSKADLVENRIKILKNGIPLSVLEARVDNKAFDSRYDVRVDPVTGRIEFQGAHLEDFGTDSLGNAVFFESYTSNKGSGKLVISTGSLVDLDAPAETWTVRCVANIKDGYGDPVLGEATFTVTGSTSGQLKDAAGNPITWKSDSAIVSNGILSFSIAEGTIGFEVGDKFTVKVNSGVLSANDKIVARYVAHADINDAETFFSAQDAFTKHGEPSATNTLSLGVQMAFENGAPVVTAIQAKPPVPRKTVEFLIVPNNPLTDDVEGATGGTTISDTVFPLPLGSFPDVDSKVNIFAVDSAGKETQLVLNKEEFYNSDDYPDTAALFADFVGGPTGAAYTVITAPQVEQRGLDGYAIALSTTEIQFTAPSVRLEADRSDSSEGDVGKQIKILTPSSLAGTYEIETVGDGYGDMTICTAVRTSGTVVANTVADPAEWQLIDPNDIGAYFAITDDVADTYLTEGMGLKVSYVDTKDAEFFDTNWGEALEAAESADIQIMVPLPLQTVSNIYQATKVHVETASNIVNQAERIALFGAIPGLKPDHLTGKKLAAVEDIGLLEGIQGDDVEEVLGGNVEDLVDYSVAKAFGDSFRCIYMWPDQIVRNIAGQNTALPGYFMAAALGGLLASQTNIAEPATFKTLAGFNILRDRTTRKPIKNELAGAGVLVVEPIAGGGKMLWGRTTVSSGAPEEEEISVVGVRDAVAKLIRDTMRKFVGRLQSPTLIPEISKGLHKTLSGITGDGRLLASFGAITVAKNSLEPRQIDIGVECSPNGPVNWIFVDQTVSL